MNVMYLDSSVEWSIALASYAIAIQDGDDTSTIAEDLRKAMQECIDYNGNADTTVVEYLNVLLPSFRSIIQTCASDDEYAIVKKRCLSEYGKFESMFFAANIIACWLDYIWIVSVHNTVSVLAFSNMYDAIAPVSMFPSIKRYILLTILNTLMGVKGYANPTLKPILSGSLELLKSMRDEGITVGEKLPHFLN